MVITNNQIIEQSHVCLFSNTYYQAVPILLNKPRISTDSSIQLKVSNKLNFNIQYVATYDTNPIINIPNLTSMLNGVLQYNF